MGACKSACVSAPVELNSFDSSMLGQYCNLALSYSVVVEGMPPEFEAANGRYEPAPGDTFVHTTSDSTIFRSQEKGDMVWKLSCGIGKKNSEKNWDFIYKKEKLLHEEEMRWSSEDGKHIRVRHFQIWSSKRQEQISKDLVLPAKFGWDSKRIYTIDESPGSAFWHTAGTKKAKLFELANGVEISGIPSSVKVVEAKEEHWKLYVKDTSSSQINFGTSLTLSLDEFKSMLSGKLSGGLNFWFSKCFTEGHTSIVWSYTCQFLTVTVQNAAAAAAPYIQGVTLGMIIHGELSAQIGERASSFGGGASGKLSNSGLETQIDMDVKWASGPFEEAGSVQCYGGPEFDFKQLSGRKVCDAVKYLQTEYVKEARRRPDHWRIVEWNVRQPANQLTDQGACPHLVVLGPIQSGKSQFLNSLSKWSKTATGEEEFPTRPRAKTFCTAKICSKKVVTRLHGIECSVHVTDTPGFAALAANACDDFHVIIRGICSEVFTAGLHNCHAMVLVVDSQRMEKGLKDMNSALQRFGDTYHDWFWKLLVVVLTKFDLKNDDWKHNDLQKRLTEPVYSADTKATDANDVEANIKCNEAFRKLANQRKKEEEERLREKMIEMWPASERRFTDSDRVYCVNSLPDDGHGTYKEKAKNDLLREWSKDEEQLLLQTVDNRYKSKSYLDLVRAVGVDGVMEPSTFVPSRTVDGSHLSQDSETLQKVVDVSAETIEVVVNVAEQETPVSAMPVNTLGPASAEALAED